MKKGYFKLIIICIGVVLIFIAYCRTYPILNDKTNIEKNILLFINRAINKYDSIDIKQEINIDNKKYILYTTTDKIGFAELIKGLNNRYKISYTEHTNDFFYDKIVTTNKGKYIFLIGKNIDEKIQYSEVELEFNKYKIKIPPQEYFMVNCKINGDTQTNLIDLNKIKYFDENGKDISDTYYWGYKYF